MSRSPSQSELIESIYDAGLHPELWSDVVVMLNDFIGSQACGLISKDTVSKSGATHYYCGVDPHYIQLYSETYSQYDPLARLPRVRYRKGPLRKTHPRPCRRMQRGSATSP